MEIVLEAGHTHLYPGLEGKVSGIDPALLEEAGAPCRIAFSDGSVAFGSLGRADDGWALDVSPYATAAGTDIPAKRWRIDLQQADGGVTFRIRRKLAV